MAKRSRGSSLLAFERKFVRARPGRTLIVGSRVYEGKEDRRRRFKDVLGVDMLAGPGVDRVIDLEERLPRDLGKFDHIECMSVLEHSRRPWLLAANLERLMKPAATLFLTVPFVWRVHGYPDDYFRFTPHGIASLFPKIRWQALRLASDHVQKTSRLAHLVDDNGHPYLARSETCGFGSRCAS